MKRTMALAVVALALSGCRTTFVEEMEKKTFYGDRVPNARDMKSVFVGVSVPKESGPESIGLKIERVLAGSPAAKAGLQPGDEIRGLDKAIVRSAHDLDAALRTVNGSTYTLVVASNGEERQVPIEKDNWESRCLELRGKWLDVSRTNDTSIVIPLIFTYEHMVLTPDVFKAWTGIAVTEPVTYYRDVAIFDLIGDLAVWRSEHTYLEGAWRLTVVWPIYTSTSDDPLEGIVAPGEDRLTVF